MLCVLVVLGCGEPGRVRVSDQELYGTWSTDIEQIDRGPVVRNVGTEQITLHPDKTYIQVFSSPQKQYVHTGQWRSSQEFLDGTKVELLNFDHSEDQAPGASWQYGPLELFVHREEGKIKLARSEPLEWYYERTN